MFCKACFCFFTIVKSISVLAFVTLKEAGVEGYGVRLGTKSILRFRGLGNTSSLRKLFFESFSVVFVASVPCF